MISINGRDVEIEALQGRVAALEAKVEAMAAAMFAFCEAQGAITSEFNAEITGGLEELRRVVRERLAGGDEDEPWSRPWEDRGE